VPDREPRPPRSAQAACGLLVVLGLWLRLMHIGFGLPANFHPDEINATAETQGFLAGRAELHKYLHPPLIKNLAFVGLELRALVERAAQPPAAATVTLALRMVSALAGAASIYLLFVVAYPLAGLAPALLVSLVLAILPLAIGGSMYGTPDMLLAFLYLAAVACHLRLARAPSAWLYALAGLTLALAVGAKYTGAFVLPSLVAAHLAGSRARAEAGRPPPGFRAWLALGGGLALGLAASFPLLPFELRDILRGGAAEVEHTMVTGHLGVRVSGRQFGMVWHFVHSILPSGGPVLVAAVVAGLFHLGRRRRPSDWILLAAIVPHYLVIEWAWLIPPSPQRYVLPLLPPYLLVVAIGLGSLAARARTSRSRVLVLTVAFLLLVPFPAWKSARFLAAVSPDTREQMTAWMRDHLPAGAWVLYEPMRSHHPDTRGLPLRWAAVDLGRPLPPLPTGQAVYFMASSFVYQRYLDWPAQVPERTRFYEHLLASGDLAHQTSAACGPFLFHNPDLRLYRLSP
jgi:hypothetical protein